MVDHQKLEVKITLRVHNRWLLCDLSHSFEFDIGEVSVTGFVQLTTLFFIFRKSRQKAMSGF